MGLTRRSERKYTIGLALILSMGGEDTEWHKAFGEWSGAQLVAFVGGRLQILQSLQGFQRGWISNR